MYARVWRWWNYWFWSTCLLKGIRIAKYRFVIFSLCLCCCPFITAPPIPIKKIAIDIRLLPVSPRPWCVGVGLHYTNPIIATASHHRISSLSFTNPIGRNWRKEGEPFWLDKHLYLFFDFSIVYIDDQYETNDFAMSSKLKLHPHHHHNNNTVPSPAPFELPGHPILKRGNCWVRRVLSRRLWTYRQLVLLLLKKFRMFCIHNVFSCFCVFLCCFALLLPKLEGMNEVSKISLPFLHLLWQCPLTTVHFGGKGFVVIRTPP